MYYFLRAPLNRFLYNVIRAIFYIVIGFILGSFFSVRAASNDTWTDVVDLKDTHLFENDMYSYIQFCNNTNLDSCAVVGRNAQSDYGWDAITVNFNTNYLRLYNNQTILKNYKKYRVVITQTGNSWTPVNSRYFITLNSIGGTNLYSSNTVYSSPDNTIYIEFTPLNNNDILDLYIRTVQAPNYFWLASGSKNFTVVKLQELASQNTDNSQEIIDNATQNTQDIINNQNNNTQAIIDNQNQNTQDIIDSNKVCNVITVDKDFPGSTGNLTSTGTVQNTSNTNYKVTDYIDISNSTLTGLVVGTNLNRSCFYSSDKSFISCIDTVPLGVLTVPQNAKYIRISVHIPFNRPVIEIKSCKNSGQAISDSLTDDSVDNEQGASFFNDFETSDNGGISGVVTAPLRLINSLLSNSNSCPDLPLQVMGANASLPSGCIIWNAAPNSVIVLYHTFICGFGAYFILRKLFKDIEDLKNPENGKVDTLEL